MYRVGGSTGVFGCRSSAKMSSLTGQQKCHTHRMAALLRDDDNPGCVCEIVRAKLEP